MIFLIIVNYVRFLNNSKKNRGFSLIELSIVLIILGLLIVGVSGGASLIQASRTRTLVNEYNQLKTAFNTYYGLYGKVPGSKGINPNSIKDVITSYNGASNDAMLDLVNSKILDKKIDRIEVDGSNIDYLASKYGKKVVWYFFSNKYFKGAYTILKNKNILLLSSEDYSSYVALTAKEAEDFDKKVDDGKASTGNSIALYKNDNAQEAIEYTKDTSKDERNWVIYNILEIQ